MERIGRLPTPTGDPRHDAVRELRWAMGGRGLLLSKVPHMAATLALPAVARAVAAAAAEDALRAAYDVIAAAAHELGESPDAKLVRAGLGLAGASTAKNLTGRRTEFVRRYNAELREAGRRDLMPETSRALYDAENAMLEALVTALGGSGRGTPAVPVPAATTYSCALYDATYRLRGRGGVETEITYVVRAERDGVCRMETGYYAGEEGPSRAAELVVREGGVVVDDRAVGHPAYRRAIIEFPAPLAPGDEHRIRFDIDYPEQLASLDTWFALVPMRRTDRAMLRIHFDPSERPRLVWRIDAVYPGARAGDPDPSAPLRPDRFGYVDAEFRDLTVGLSYGVGWEW